MKVTILGSGTSGGVPQLGCQCTTCTSSDPRDHRLRCSALVQEADTSVLIDCGPDFRQQMLTHGLPHIHGIVITHEHYDHVGGIDDLRPAPLFPDLPIYAEQMVCEHLMQRIPYCFTPKEKRYLGVPSITLHPLTLHEPLHIGSLTIKPFRVMHGNLPIVALRIGNFTYITDMKTMPEEEFPMVEGTEVLVVNALHHREHPSHQTIDEAIRFAQRVGAKQTYFIHMSHFILPHCEEEKLLPAGINLAYDGLQFCY